MRKTIIIGSIFACFLMLMIPTISAIECNIIRNNGPDYDEEELKEAILERIEEIKEINPSPKLCLWGDDPDGPFEGGLDDPTDWKDLFIAIFNGFIVGTYISDIPEIIDLILSLKLLSVSIYIITFGLYSSYTLIELGDAFDIIDPDEDGC